MYEIIIIRDDHNYYKGQVGLPEGSANNSSQFPISPYNCYRVKLETIGVMTQTILLMMSLWQPHKLKLK